MPEYDEVVFELIEVRNDIDVSMSFGASKDSKFFPAASLAKTLRPGRFLTINLYKDGELVVWYDDGPDTAEIDAFFAEVFSAVGN